VDPATVLPRPAKHAAQCGFPQMSPEHVLPLRGGGASLEERRFWNEIARRDGVAHLTSLQHPTQLGIWNASYDDDGWCSDARCAAGLHAAMGGSAPVVSDDSIADDGLNDDDYAEPMHL
jgi:hypothetical protein